MLDECPNRWAGPLLAWVPLAKGRSDTAFWFGHQLHGALHTLALTPKSSLSKTRFHFPIIDSDKNLSLTFLLACRHSNHKPNSTFLLWQWELLLCQLMVHGDIILRHTWDLSCPHLRGIMGIVSSWLCLNGEDEVHLVCAIKNQGTQVNDYWNLHLSRCGKDKTSSEVLFHLCSVQGSMWINTCYSKAYKLFSLDNLFGSFTRMRLL